MRKFIVTLIFLTCIIALLVPCLTLADTSLDDMPSGGYAKANSYYDFSKTVNKTLLAKTKGVTIKVQKIKQKNQKPSITFKITNANSKKIKIKFNSIKFINSATKTFGPRGWYYIQPNSSRTLTITLKPQIVAPSGKLKITTSAKKGDTKLFTSKTTTLSYK